MRFNPTVGSRRFSFLLALCVYAILCSKVSAQTPDAKLNRLKQKYPWGNIYLTYIPIVDLTNALTDAAKFRSASRQDGEEIITVLANFLKTHKRPAQRDAIAFIVIDLNRVKAGFKWANDNSGGIKEIEWRPDQVIQVAVICDKLLEGQLAFERLQATISSSTASIQEAWTGIQEVTDSAYVPVEKVSPLLTKFRELIANKPDELNRLETKDKQLYTKVESFKFKFDDSVKIIAGQMSSDKTEF